MLKICQRCQSQFDCLAEDITNCGCFSVTLSDSTRAYLSKTSYDCLCVSCLEELNTLVNLGTDLDNLQEGIHYYYEGLYRVMTEYYHIQRGYCCKSGCRHCAYPTNN